MAAKNVCFSTVKAAEFSNNICVGSEDQLSFEEKNGGRPRLDMYVCWYTRAS